MDFVDTTIRGIAMRNANMEPTEIVEIVEGL